MISYDNFNCDDVFGNTVYPKSVFNSVIGYDGNDFPDSVFFLAISIFVFFDCFIYFGGKNRFIEDKIYYIQKYIYMILKYFLISLFLFMTNLLATLCLIPMVTPEIASFDFPMSYTQQYGNELYYDMPLLHIILSIFFRSLIYSMTVTVPLILIFIKKKVAYCINIIIGILNLTYFILSIKCEAIKYFPFLIPFNNDYYSLKCLLIYFFVLLLCNIIFLSKNRLYLKTAINKKVCFPRKSIIVFMVLGMCLIIFVLLRIVRLNDSFQNQETYVVHQSTAFDINETTIKIENVEILEQDNFYESYNIKIRKYQLNKTNKVVLAYFSLENNKNDKVYFDFSNCYLMINQWFTNLDMELFDKINPSMNGNVKVCLRETSKVNIVVPFLLTYDDLNDNDSLYYSLKHASSIFLYVGKYPIKYRYCIENSLVTEFRFFRYTSTI